MSAASSYFTFAVTIRVVYCVRHTHCARDLRSLLPMLNSHLHYGLFVYLCIYTVYIIKRYEKYYQNRHIELLITCISESRSSCHNKIWVGFQNPLPSIISENVSKLAITPTNSHYLFVCRFVIC